MIIQKFSLTNFESHLNKKGVLKKSRDAYISDIRMYLKWLNASGMDESNIVEKRNIENYLKSLNVSNNSLVRKTTSFKHLQNFLQSEIFNTDDVSLRKFAKVLKRESASPTTINNYLSDVRAFQNWRKENQVIQSDILEKYKIVLSSKVSSSSVKRKISSVRKFLSIENNSSFKARHENPKSLKQIHFIGGILVFIIALFASQITKTNKEQFFNLDTRMSVIEDTIVSTPKKVDLVNSEIMKLPRYGDNQDIKIALTPDIYSVYTETTSLDLAEANADVTYDTSTKQGVSTIYRGATEVTIFNDLISPDSFIYLTSRSNPQNKVLFVSSQTTGSAVISISEPIDNDLVFQWKIDNTELYRSIL